MIKIAISIAAVFLMLGFASISPAQDQKPGQELVFPKDQVKEHPSDIHMGSDPYYRKENKKYEGSDEQGYPRSYDPNTEYREITTTTKKVDKKKKPEDEPAE